MGGSLQLQFGIKGKRWLTMAEYREAMGNPNWVKPDASERPPSSHVIENSAYWFDDEKKAGEKKAGGERPKSAERIADRQKNMQGMMQRQHQLPYQQLPRRSHQPPKPIGTARAQMGGRGGPSHLPTTVRL